jgi:hypothetical protein
MNSKGEIPIYSINRINAEKCMFGAAKILAIYPLHSSQKQVFFK